MPKPGVVIDSLEPQEGDRCQYGRRREGIYVACDQPAHVTLVIGTNMEDYYLLRLCRKCLVRMTRRLVTLLE